MARRMIGCCWWIMGCMVTMVEVYSAQTRKRPVPEVAGSACVNIYIDHPAEFTFNFPSRSPLQVVPHVDQAGIAVVEQGWWGKIHNIFINTIPKAPWTLYSAARSALTFVQEHKWAVLFNGATALYLYVNYRLYALERFLHDTDRWFRWRNELTLVQMSMMPQHELAADLVQAARTRNICGYATCTDSEVLVAVAHELAHELDMCNQYQSLARFVGSIDDAQRRCALFCDTALPHVCGVPAACLVKGVLTRISANQLFYVREELLYDIVAWRNRLELLATVIANTRNAADSNVALTDS